LKFCSNFTFKLQRYPAPAVGQDFDLREVHQVRFNHGWLAVDGLRPRLDEGFFRSPPPSQVLRSRARKARIRSIRRSITACLGMTAFQRRKHLLKSRTRARQLLGKAGEVY